MNTIVFTIALYLSAYTLMRWVLTLLDKKPSGTNLNVALTVIVWGFYHYLSH